MTGLVTYNTAPTLVEIRMDAERFPRLKDMDETVAVEALAKVVGRAFQLTGRKFQNPDVAYIAATLYEVLMEDEDAIGTRLVTIEEVGRCVRRAVLGQGPEMYGINVASLYTVIADYCQGEGHLAQVEASRIIEKQRRKELVSSTAGALMACKAAEMIKNNKIR